MRLDKRSRSSTTMLGRASHAIMATAVDYKILAFYNDAATILIMVLEDMQLVFPGRRQQRQPEDPFEDRRREGCLRKMWTVPQPGLEYVPETMKLRDISSSWKLQCQISESSSTSTCPSALSPMVTRTALVATTTFTAESQDIEPFSPAHGNYVGVPERHEDQRRGVCRGTRGMWRRYSATLPTARYVVHKPYRKPVPPRARSGDEVDQYAESSVNADTAASAAETY